MNNNGPRMDSCGTPYVKSRISDFSPLTHSLREALYSAPQFELHFPKSAIWRSLL